MGFLDRFRKADTSPDDLLSRVLLVPTPETGEPLESGVIEEDRTVSFVVLHDDDGRTVLPAFTSESALCRWRPEGSPYMGLEGQALVEMMAESDWDRIVVDIADPEPVTIPRSAAAEREGTIEQSIPAGSTLVFGQPAQAPPDGLIGNVWRACEAEAAVEEAFLYQFGVVERDEPPHLTIGIRLNAPVDQAEKGRIAQSIGGAADPPSWGYEFLDLQFLEGKRLDTVRSQTAAIFRRDDELRAPDVG